MGFFDRMKKVRVDPRAQFWSWFLANKERVAQMIHDGQAGMEAYEELTTEVKKVHEAIVPELTEDEDGTHVLVISADGRKEAVQPVMDLCDAAPVIGGWRNERFRKPAPEGMRINYQGLDIDPADVRVAYQVDTKESVVHIAMLLPGYEETDQRFLGLGFLYLDHTIGEYNTIMHIGHIEFRGSEEAPPNAHLITLVDLRKMIEAEFY